MKELLPKKADAKAKHFSFGYLEGVGPHVALLHNTDQMEVMAIQVRGSAPKVLPTPRCGAEPKRGQDFRCRPPYVEELKIRV